MSIRVRRAKSSVKNDKAQHFIVIRFFKIFNGNQIHELQTKFTENLRFIQGAETARMADFSVSASALSAERSSTVTFFFLIVQGKKIKKNQTLTTAALPSKNF